MEKEVQKIIDQIKQLIDQLGAMVTTKVSGNKPLIKTISKTKKGASGALSMLIEEGFFDTPKDLSEIMRKLQEIGHWHRNTTVSMNLLNLTKRRTFNRLRDTKDKKWKYVLRR